MGKIEMALIESDYRAPSWAKGGHVQTVVPAKLGRRPEVMYRREVVETPDADIVAWDWVDPASGAEDAPILVHFHGLEGSSRSHYAQYLMHWAEMRGWRGVVAHFRGCGGLPNLKPRAYHAGDTADNFWVLKTVHERFPNAPMYAVGVSLGGNQLAKCLGEKSSELGFLMGAASVCAPIDLVAGSERISKGVNVFYANMFLETLKEKYIEKSMRFPELFSRSEAEKCRTMFDFDESYTSKVHGFKSAMDYWQSCSAKKFLKRVRRPLLLLNSKNDPFLPEWVLPEESEVSSWVTLEYPEEGGHVGFPVGSFPGGSEWLPERIFRYFDGLESKG